MPIRSCCISRLDGTHRPCGGTYRIHWALTSDEPYEINKLILDAQAFPGCVPLLGSTYPGYGVGMQSQADANSTLVEIAPIRPTTKGDTYHYILQGTFEPTQQTGDRPQDQEECDPLLWCPQFSTREVVRQMPNENMIFKGIFEAPLANATDDCKTSPECVPQNLLNPMAPDETGGGTPTFTLNQDGCYLPINTANQLIGGLMTDHYDVEVNLRMWYPLSTSSSWKSGVVHVIGDIVLNDANTYVATSNGTSGNVPPIGTGTGIDDGGVLWDYVPPDQSMWNDFNLKQHKGCTNKTRYTLNIPCLGGELWVFEPDTGLITWTYTVITTKCDCQILRRGQVDMKMLWAECGHMLNPANLGTFRLGSQGGADGYGGNLPGSGGGIIIGNPGTTGSPILSADEFSNPITTPVPLDENGQPDRTEKAKYWFSRWNPNPECEWNDFLP